MTTPPHRRFRVTLSPAGSGPFSPIEGLDNSVMFPCFGRGHQVWKIEIIGAILKQLGCQYHSFIFATIPSNHIGGQQIQNGIT